MIIFFIINMANLQLFAECTHHNITDIPPELANECIDGLDLSNNNISIIKNLPCSLTSLCLSNNCITNIINLPHLITYLKLDNNQIVTIDNLPQLLVHLDLSHNRINKIKNLPQTLKSLVLTNNQITKIENLPLNLLRLSIEYNPIKHFDYIGEALTHLQILPDSSYTYINDLRLFMELDLLYDITNDILIELVEFEI